MTRKFDLRSADLDSSPGFEDYRPYDAGDGTNPGWEGVIIIRIDLNEDLDRKVCACGCRQQVAKGSTFLQGHDARFKGILIRAYLRGDEVDLIESGGLAIGTDALHLATERGWERFLLEAAKRFEAKASKAQARAERKSAPKGKGKESPMIQAKVGRWTYKGFVTSDGKFAYTAKDGSARLADKFQAVA